jgi:uracil-DNA glycosylase family 4
MVGSGGTDGKTERTGRLSGKRPIGSTGLKPPAPVPAPGTASAARIHPPRPSRSLATVSRRIIHCTACPRLIAYCREVAREKKPEFRDWEYWGKPVPGFGDPDARLLIVGLAPAAHGANRTGRMFTGDSSGTWVSQALHRFGFASQPASVSRDDGLTLTDCYVTAAARCAPPGNKPTAAELGRCRRYLASELRLLTRIRVVLALGRIAHQSVLRASGWWERLTPNERPAFAHGAVSRLPDGTHLVASYHPSRQNTNTGRLTRRMWDRVFGRVKELLE